MHFHFCKNMAFCYGSFPLNLSLHRHKLRGIKECKILNVYQVKFRKILLLCIKLTKIPYRKFFEQI